MVAVLKFSTERLRRRRANLLALVDPFSLPAMPLQRSRLVVIRSVARGCQLDNFRASRCFDLGMIPTHTDLLVLLSNRFRLCCFIYFSSFCCESSGPVSFSNSSTFKLSNWLDLLIFSAARPSMNVCLSG